MAEPRKPMTVEQALAFADRSRRGRGKEHFLSIVIFTLAAEVRRLQAENERLREALEPFAKAADVCDDSPTQMAALRASFDYPLRSLGRNNDEIVGHDSVRVGDLRRARAALAGEGRQDGR